MWSKLKGQKLALGIICILMLEIPFKFMHWPGADAMGLISFPFLILHQFRFFFVKNKQVGNLVKAVGLSAFLALWTGLTFLLKKFIPETESFYIISIASAGILLYVLLLTLSNEKPVYRRLDLLIHVFVVLSLFKVITRQNEINYTHSLSKGEYFEVLAELKTIQSRNDSLFTSIQAANPDPALSIYLDVRTTDELVSRIAYTKKLLAEQLARDFFVSPDTLMLDAQFAANKSIPSDRFVFNKSNEPIDASLEDYQIPVLKEKIEKWRKTRLYRLDEVDRYVSNSLLNTAEFPYVYANGITDTLIWTDALFFRVPSIEFLGNLNRLMLDLEKVKALQLLHFTSEDEVLFAYVFETNHQGSSRSTKLNELVSRTNKADAFTAQSYLILWGIALYFIALLALVKRLPKVWIKGGIFLFFILLFELFFLELEPLLTFYFPGDLLPVYAINFVMAASLVPVHQFFQDLFLKSFRHE